MDEKTVTGLFEEMKGDVSDYVKSNLELAKLEVFEKLSKASANISVTMALVRILTLCLALIFITLGFFLADVLGSNWQGFAISTAGAILILLILFFLRKSLKRSITNSVVSFLMRNDDEELTFKTKN